MTSSANDSPVSEPASQNLNVPVEMSEMGSQGPIQEAMINPLVNSSIAYPTPPITNTESATFLSKNFSKFLLLIVLCLMVGGSFVFAYIKKVGPFSSSTYTEENFSSKIVAKIMEIHSASYVFSTAVNVVPRDADATPFVTPADITGEGAQNSESSKIFLTQLSEGLSMIPPDMKAKIAVGASVESKSQVMADWSFNIDAEGDLGDMTYKVNVDALRKDDTYYFKINNIPSIFLFGQLASAKGKWLMLSTHPEMQASDTITTQTEPALLGYVQDGIIKNEELYKKNRDKIVTIIKMLTKMADEGKIVVFKKSPISEEIEGRKLTRYELSVRKDKIADFYIKAAETLNKEFETEEYAVDQKDLDYIKSEEFGQAFDYIDQNNSFVVWVDTAGFPVIVENTMRIIPPDTAVQLKEKQINIIFKLAITNINTPVTITAPTDAVPIETILSDMPSLNSTVQKITNTEMIAELSTINTTALMLYADTQTYGTKPFPIGPCQLTADTLFAEPEIAKVLNEMTHNNMSIATCAARGRIGKVQVWALSIPHPENTELSYCIDSSHPGKVGEIQGKLSKVPVCNFQDDQEEKTI